MNVPLLFPGPAVSEQALLSLLGLNDATRTSGNLEGLAVGPSARLTPPSQAPKCKLQYQRIKEGVGDKDKWSDFDSWFYTVFHQ